MRHMDKEHRNGGSRKAWMPLLLLALVAGCPLGAKGPGHLDGFEASAGFSGFKLKPGEGPAQNLDGVFLGGRAGWGGPWSVEVILWRQTGTDAKGVDLRQWGLQAGPRYTWNLGRELDAFAHALVGGHRLEATQGLARDHETSPGLSLGLGLDWRLDSRWALRAGADGIQTRYASRDQRSFAVSLGAAFRW